MKSTDPITTCSFCAKHKDAVAKLIVGEDVAICNVFFPVLPPTQTYPSLKDAVNDELTFILPLKLILPFLIFNEPEVRYSDNGASNPILTSLGK